MPMLDRFHLLEGEIRVRLRLARTTDRARISDLLERAGADASHAVQLVRFDPRRRVVVCATALVDSREMIVGIGAIDVDRDRPSRADELFVDERFAEARGLLEQALTARACDRTGAVVGTRAA